MRVRCVSENDDIPDEAIRRGAEQSRAVLSRPALTLFDLKERAKIAAQWNGGHINADGSVYIDGLKSKKLGKRAVAELILAVLRYKEPGIDAAKPESSQVASRQDGLPPMLPDSSGSEQA